MDPALPAPGAIELLILSPLPSYSLRDSGLPSSGVQTSVLLTTARTGDAVIECRNSPGGILDFGGSSRLQENSTY